MQIRLPSGDLAQLIGDPHVDRTWRNGVPLHRLGDREAMLWEAFQKAMTPQSDQIRYMICVGDLWERWNAPHTLIVKVIQFLQLQLTRYPGVSFIFLEGNHDSSRDRSLSGAFHLLCEAFRQQPRVSFVPVGLRQPLRLSIGVVLVPWIEEQGFHWNVNEWQPGDIVVGHFDVEDFGTANPNLVPTQLFAQHGITQVYTGHDHKPRTIERDGVTVHVVGSLQPLAHGQEADGDESLYVTRTLDEFLTGGEDFHNRCLRLVLQVGQVAPADIDCLHLTIKRLDAVDDENIAVGFEAFEMKKVMDDVFFEQAVPPAVADRIRERFRLKVT